MIAQYKHSTITKMILGIVLAMSVIFWGVGCSFLEFITGENYHNVEIGFTGPTGGDRFYNARVVRDFTLNLAEGVAASCRHESMVRHLRALAQDIDDAIDLFIDTPEGNARVINAINAAARDGRVARDEILECGGNPPEVPNIPGYRETFWDIAS